MIHEEDGFYGVSFPDFPGARTVADDLDSAVVTAAEMLAFHAEELAEDGPLPQFRSLSELQRDPEFRADSNGAVLVLVPYAASGRLQAKKYNAERKRRHTQAHQAMGFEAIPLQATCRFPNSS
jgi:predicted RNase H-like HicB family nuclease